MWTNGCEKWKAESVLLLESLTLRNLRMYAQYLVSIRIS